MILMEENWIEILKQTFVNNQSNEHLWWDCLRWKWNFLIKFFSSWKRLIPLRIEMDTFKPSKIHIQHHLLNSIENQKKENNRQKISFDRFWWNSHNSRYVCVCVCVCVHMCDGEERENNQRTVTVSRPGHWQRIWYFFSFLFFSVLGFRFLFSLFFSLSPLFFDSILEVLDFYFFDRISLRYDSWMILLDSHFLFSLNHLFVSLPLFLSLSLSLCRNRYLFRPRNKECKFSYSRKLFCFVFELDFF